MKALVFDFDGTIVFSTRAHAKSFVEALKKFGFDYEEEDIIKMIGMKGKFLARKLANEKSEEVNQLRKKLFEKKYIKEVKLNEELIDIIKKARNCGIKICIFTSSSRKTLFKMLKYFKIEHLFDDFICADDVKKGKPDPEGLLKLKKKYEVIAFVGDTVYDVEAADRANVEFVHYKKIKDWWKKWSQKHC